MPKKVFFVFKFLSSFLISLLIFVFVLTPLVLASTSRAEEAGQTFLLWLVVFMLILLVFLLSYYLIYRDKNKRLSQCENKREEIEREYKQQKQQKEEKDIDENTKKFYVLRLKLGKIDEFYIIHQAQTNSIFCLSIFLILLGFLMIMASVFGIGTIIQPTLKRELSLISGISGVLLQFLGGVNLIVYNKTLQQANRFYNKLIETYDKLVSIKVKLPSKRKSTTSKRHGRSTRREKHKHHQTRK